MVVGDENAISIGVDGETIDMVKSLRYLEVIETNTGSCSEDIKARTGRTKNATMALDTIWKDTEIRNELKITLTMLIMACDYIRNRRMDFQKVLQTVHQ